MTRSEALDILKNKPIFWSRMGFCYDPPIYDEDGKPLAFSRDFDKYKRYHNDFCSAGVPVHTCILHSGWVGENKFDYSLTDEVLDAVLADGKVKWFFPRIKLNVPVDWCANHPEDILVYYDGPRDAEGIRALVDTDKHDWLGYDAPMGYYVAGNKQNGRPNVGGQVARQSFSSGKWLEDAGYALRKLIRHIEDGPYADKVIAYQIAYGTSGESMLWGRDSVKTGDYGINNQKAFFEWYKQNIDPNVVWTDGDFVPAPNERMKGSDELYSQFRDGKRDERAIAYDCFMTDVNVSALNYFGNIVKEESGKLAGAFYGYLIHVTRSAYTGFLGWQKLIDEGKIDFFAAPKSYYRSGFGESGGEMAPFMSINRNTLWIDECDIRTHLSIDSIGGMAADLSQSHYMMWREFTKNAAHDSGCWWMDLGDGWYDAPELMSEVAKISEINKAIKQKQHESVADILFVVDSESFKYADERFNQKIIEHNLRQLQRCGCAIDMALQSDLDNISLAQYKLIMFANAFCMTKQELESIERRTDAKILFNYAAGICGENTDLCNCTALTGYDFTWEKGLPAKLTAAGSSDRYFVNTEIPASVEFFRSICEKSGCHAYSPEDTFVYADNRIIGVYSSVPMEFELKMKKVCTLKNVRTGEIFENVSSIPLRLEDCFDVFIVI